jgi:hypothetical protein
MIAAGADSTLALTSPPARSRQYPITVNQYGSFTRVWANRTRCLPAALIPVDVGHGEHQMIDLDHHQRLNEIPVDGVAHPRPARLNLQPAPPTWVVGVDLIPQLGDSVLPEEHGPFDLLVTDLALLDLKPECLQLRVQHAPWASCSPHAMNRSTRSSGSIQWAR